MISKSKTTGIKTHEKLASDIIGIIGKETFLEIQVSPNGDIKVTYDDTSLTATQKTNLGNYLTAQNIV